MAELLAAQGSGRSADQVGGAHPRHDGARRAGGAVVVIEAVAEDLAAKHDVLAAVEDVVAPGALLATNTSGLRVTDIAAPLRHRERVVALHFWNPAHLMPIVEVAGGEHAAPRRGSRRPPSSSRAIGKVPVVLRHEVLGFLGTRMQQAVVREAIALLDAGVASAADIDLRRAHELRDPVPGDRPARVGRPSRPRRDRRHPHLPAARPRPARRRRSRALTDRVARGELGAKSGRGFHEWPGQRVGRGGRPAATASSSAGCQRSRPRAGGGGAHEAEPVRLPRAGHRSTECVALLAEHGDDAKPLAGGQSLVPLMNLRLAAPAVLVDLNRDRRARVRARRAATRSRSAR